MSPPPQATHTPPPPASSTTLWTRPFCYLTLSHLLGALGYSSMLLLPLYLAHLGGSRAEIGAVMSSAHLAGLLTRPLVGWCLDHFGRRRSLVLGGLLTALSLASVGLITAVGPFAYGVRALFGAAEGFLFTGYFAFASDLIPEKRRTEGLALFGVAGLLPLLVNPISDALGFEGASLRPFIVGVSALVALSALLVLMIPREVEERAQNQASELQEGSREGEPQEGEPQEEGGLKETLKRLVTPALRPIWWATLTFSGGVALMMTFASVVGEARGLEHPTSLWFTYVIGALMARLVGAKLPERVGPARLVAPSLCLYGLGVLCCALSTGEGGLLLAGLLSGVAHGYCFPVLTSLTVSAVAPDFRGRALATFTGIWGGAAMLIAPLAGKIADLWGDERMLISFSLLIIGKGLLTRPKSFS